MIDLRYYITAAGKNVVADWLASLSDEKLQSRIAARLTRLAAGNFGDCKFLREGVRELRIDIGPGFRVYFAMAGKECVLLLCGGEKRTTSNRPSNT